MVAIHMSALYQQGSNSCDHANRGFIIPTVLHNSLYLQ